MTQFVADVLVRTVDLALIAVALSSVYSLIRFPNVALVQYATIGAFLALALQALGFGLTLAIAFSCLLVGALAIVLNVLVFERLLRSGSAIAMVGSLALGMVLSAVLLLAGGVRTQRFALDPRPPVEILGATVTHTQIISLLVSVGAIGVFAAILFWTDLGRCMRAVATNSVLARATGVNNRQVTNVVVFISGVLAALGGIGLALKGEASIQLGNDLLLPVFAAAILGGLGNALGAVVGALVIATAETLVTNINFGPLLGQSYLFIPAAYATAGSFALLTATLLLRPTGLFVSEVKRV